MDFRPPNLLLLLLLLTGHLLFVQCDTGQPYYTIDGVDLSIQPSTTVLTGEKVTIGCKVRVSHANIPNLTHIFQIKRDGTVIHSSTTTEDSIAYELNPARAADSGVYVCRVAVKEKNKASPSSKLEVSGLQTPILYLSKTTFYKDEDFKATCSAPEEKGSLMFSFFQIFQNKRPEKIAQLAFTGNSSETTLVLKQTGNYTLYCEYEIILVPKNRPSSHSNKIEVEVEEAQIYLEMDVKPLVEVFEGDLLEVVCKVTTSLKKVEVFLKNTTNILKKSYGSFNHQFRIYESGEIVCKAEWNSVQKQVNQTVTLKELFSKPNLTLKSVELFEGDRMQLECSVSHYASERIRKENIQYSIYRNNRKIIPTQNYITVAHKSQNGNYTCRVQTTNYQVNIFKESQALAIQAKVLVSEPVLSVVGDTLVLGKSFQVLCASDHGSLPITYTLWRPGMRFGEPKTMSTREEQAIFNCSAIFDKSLLKNFICHAKNSQNRPPTVADGSQLLHSTTIIEPVSEPVLTIVPNMGDVSEGQDVTLLCAVQRGTLPIFFTWYHTEKDGVLISQLSQKLKASHIIRNVRGDNKGGYFCTGTNSANETKKSRIIMIGVKMAGWKKGLIAVLCILLILALVLVIAIKTRLLHFRRKRTDRLSVKSASTKVERLSLTQAEVNEAANVTPGMMGKSVWSDQTSGSETDDQNSVTATEPEYKEVKTSEPDPIRAPVETGTDTVHNEVRNSKQGVPERADGTSVEYAQLNHDTDHYGDHSEQSNFSVQDEHMATTDNNSVDTNTADDGE